MTLSEAVRRSSVPVDVAATEMTPMPMWCDVCELEEVIPGTGVAALVQGEQIAIVRTRDGRQVHAISNFDPFSKAFVMSRGIVGDRAGVAKIASPIYKQSFDLKTGVCLDDPNVSLPVFSVRVSNGRIQVALANGRRTS